MSCRPSSEGPDSGPVAANFSTSESSSCAGASWKAPIADGSNEDRVIALGLIGVISSDSIGAPCRFVTSGGHDCGTVLATMEDARCQQWICFLAVRCVLRKKEVRGWDP